MNRLFQWAFCIWLVGATVRYASTIWKTLHQPFNPGNDSAWFTGWICACAALLLAAALLPRRTVLRVTLGLSFVVAAVVITRSQSWSATLVAACVLAVCAGVGRFVLASLRIRTVGIPEAITLAVPAGMAAIALALFVLGVAGAFGTGIVTGLIGVVGLLLVLIAATKPALLQSAIGTKNPSSQSAPAGTLLIRTDAVLVGLIALSALLNLTWAVSPEVQFDGLNYHLAVPDAYLRAGAIIDLRYMHAYLSRMIELLFTPLLAASGPVAVKLFIYGLSLCATVGTYALGTSLVDRTVGLWAAALFYTTPAVAWMTGTAYIDNIAALLTASVLLAFVKWMHDEQPGWFPIACLIAGFAVGSKVNAAFAVVVVLSVMALGIRRQWRILGIGAALFGLVALPYYVLTWKFTGNPVFPLLNGIFKSPLWHAENTVFTASNYGLAVTGSNLLIFPFRLTLDTLRFGEAPRGAMGLSLLLLFPFVFFLLRRSGMAVKVLLSATLVYLTALFVSMQYVRYVVTMLPAITVLGAATAFAALGEEAGRLRRGIVEVCLVMVLVLQLPALSTQYWNIPERFPVAVALGFESREAFAERAMGGYAAAMHIRRTARPDDRVLGVNTENLRYYVVAPLDTPPLSLLDSAARRLSTMLPGPELAAAIQKAGYTRLLVRNEQLAKTPPAYPFLDPAFLTAHATIEFRDSSTTVFRFP